MELEQELLAMYADEALEVKPKELEGRGGAFYSEAAAMLMESLYGDRGDVQVVNVLNQGAIPDLAADAVVETACRIDREGAHPLPVDPLAPEMHGLGRARQGLRAARRPGRRRGQPGPRVEGAARQPARPGLPDGGGLLEALLEANRPLLPRFFTAG